MVGTAGSGDNALAGSVAGPSTVPRGSSLSLPTLGDGLLDECSRSHPSSGRMLGFNLSLRRGASGRSSIRGTLVYNVQPQHESGKAHNRMEQLVHVLSSE